MNIETKSTKGVTLIEVLVITAIVLLVGAGIYQIFTNKNTDTDNKKEQSEELKVKTKDVDVKVDKVMIRKKNDDKSIDADKSLELSEEKK